MYAVTGASGQLGRLVLAALVERVGAQSVIALARQPEVLADWAAQGVAVRAADYDDPASLGPALSGATHLLLISGNAIGRRLAQHHAVLSAALAARVGFVAYTSILHAPHSTIGLAAEHRETETLLAALGVPHALLRNGWYNENYTGNLAPSLAAGVLAGASGAGRIAAASRADYAAAAAVVLAGGAVHAGQAYELAGDSAFTMADFAAEVARQARQPLVYQDLPEDDYAALLASVGLPEPVARLIASSSAKAGRDQLFDNSGTLSRLIGRPTTPIATTIAAALAA